MTGFFLLEIQSTMEGGWELVKTLFVNYKIGSWRGVVPIHKLQERTNPPGIGLI